MQIVYFPDEALTKSCEHVTEFDDQLRLLVENMTNTMYASSGVGLAAPQVGVDKNIIVIDPSGQDKKELAVLVNPKALWSSKETISYSEGCLSIPGIFVAVERPEWIEVEYQNIAGEFRTDKFGGWAARIIQHEIDHLEGLLMFDRLDKKTRTTILNCYGPSTRRRHRHT